MRIRDPGSGIFLALDPGSRMEKIGSGINIPDPQHYWYENTFFILLRRVSAMYALPRQ
jgi:hypothetical protein